MGKGADTKAEVSRMRSHGLATPENKRKNIEVRETEHVLVGGQLLRCIFVYPPLELLSSPRHRGVIAAHSSSSSLTSIVASLEKLGETRS